jgi:hypothetical protein
LLTYKLVKDKIILEKDGVYFSLTEQQASEAIFSIRCALVQKKYGLNDDEMREYLEEQALAAEHGMFS